MNEPTNTDVLDAVTLELSRFTREVVAEMHRLRDELITERQRADQLESTVQSLKASLRKYDTQAAGIVDHITKFCADVDLRLDAVERHAELPTASFASAIPAPPAAEHRPPLNVAADPLASVGADPVVPVDDEICFATLTLTLDPVEPEPARDSSIEDLVARVVGATEPPEEPMNRSDLVEPGRA
jgi:hypothetical protein